MGSTYDDLPDHEGYALRGDDASWRATCSCGWSEDPVHVQSLDDEIDGYDAAVDRWSTAHARPLLERAVPFEIAELIEETRRALVRLVNERPQAAALALEGINRWTAVLRQRTGVEVPSPSVSERLDALQRRAQRDFPRLGR